MSRAPIHGDDRDSIVIDNDFDPDGDSISIVRASTRHTAPSVRTPERRSATHPTPDSPASRPSPTHIRDSHGLTATGLAHGVGRHRRDRTGSHRRPTSTTCTSIKAPSVSFTTAELLSNDTDPQGQALDGVSVSEPGTDGTLTGDLTTGFTYTPTNDPALINTDHDLNYLVTDTDGHVAQSNIDDPHPRHRRPQPTTRRP